MTANEEASGNSKAEATSSEESTGVDCEVDGSSVPVKKATLTNLKTGTALVFATGDGTASFSFTALLPGPTDCIYAGTNVPFTYSTTTMTNSIKFSGVALTGSPSICGSATLSANFALTTTSDGISGRHYIGKQRRQWEKWLTMPALSLAIRASSSRHLCSRGQAEAGLMDNLDRLRARVDHR